MGLSIGSTVITAFGRLTLDTLTLLTRRRCIRISPNLSWIGRLRGTTPACLPMARCAGRREGGKKVGRERREEGREGRDRGGGQ